MHTAAERYELAIIQRATDIDKVGNAKGGGQPDLHTGQLLCFWSQGFKHCGWNTWLEVHGIMVT